ncbi:cytochrome c oxidase subunit II [Tianweitania aestuarii]|uniref:cytochrome c oxidase subunit II n=1 Tax=Tianweitania aestuarii TaxID=2814886 RepID=UPI002022E7DC|nr:cytochrome c oxidase subunit II [Tianweitania aestuarii]
MLLAGCGGDLSALDPAGPNAHNVATLWWIMLWGSTAIFLFVSLILCLALTQRGQRLLSPRWLLIGGGLAFPSVVLVALVAVSLALGERLLVYANEAPLRIEAVARQWQWEFRYGDDTNIATLDKLHIPAGRPVDFAVTSDDVIHSFWIPRLGGKMDAIPGHTNTIRLMADKPGTYGGVCAEFCGEGHAIMRFSVQAHEPNEFNDVMQQLSASRAERQQ